MSRSVLARRTKQAFLATASEAVRAIESELKRFGPAADTTKMRALEIGCGPGRLMKPLSRHFGEIYGVDVSDEMIRIARERLRDIPNAHAEATNRRDAAAIRRRVDRFHLLLRRVPAHPQPRRCAVVHARGAARPEAGRNLPGAVQRAAARHQMPDTWSGVTFSADDLKTFTRENGFGCLLSKESTRSISGRPGEAFSSTLRRERPMIRRITNAHTVRDAGPGPRPSCCRSDLGRGSSRAYRPQHSGSSLRWHGGKPYYIGPGCPAICGRSTCVFPRSANGPLPVETCGATSGSASSRPDRWCRVLSL